MEAVQNALQQLTKLWQLRESDNFVLYSVLTSGLLGAVLAIYLANPRPKNRKLPPPRILPDGARASPFTKGDQLLGTIFQDVTTLWEAFQRGMRISKDQPCIGTMNPDNKSYNWSTYAEVYQQVLKCGSGLHELCWSKHPSDTARFVGAWMSNRPEFFVAEFASFADSNVIVPLYDTLGKEAVFHIIDQTQLQVIICDKSARVDLLFDGNREVKTVKLVVLVGNATELKDSTRQAAQAQGVQITTYNELLEIGSKHPHALKEPKPADLALISYTSGTTGLPKGVMLTHEGIVACTSAAVQYLLEIDIVWTPEEVHYSYLPMAHVYEQVMHFSSLMHGSSIGYSRGDPRKMFEDVAVLKPTVFSAVPRILNRVYDAQQKLFDSTSFGVRLLYRLGLRYKLHLLKRGIVTHNTWVDKTTFAMVRNLFGGRIRLLTCGSAPVAKDVLLWYRCVLGVPVFEGYGQTETSAAATGTNPFDLDAGHVGVPFSCNLIKLFDVPDMNYHAKDNKGEVCVKGLNCTKGYYRDPVKTKELLDDDGWLHTGDIGTWDASGNLKIIDRKKHIFKLAQGEYVAPEKIEAVYQQCELVAQIFVDGCSLETCTVAIVVPDREQLVKLWEHKVKSFDSSLNGETDIRKQFEALCANRNVRIALLKRLVEIGKTHGLTGFEQVKNVFLSTMPFTLENDLLTPTMKTKRPEVRKLYSSQIATLYDEIRAIGELK